MEYPRYVYALQNKDTKKIYVGSTFNLSNRYDKHLLLLKKGEHFSKELQKDYDEGHTELDLYILDEIFCSKELNKEYQWMRRLHSSIDENGYNKNLSNPHHIPSFVKNGIPENVVENNVQDIAEINNENFNFGKNLKYLRRKKSLSQDELAKKINTSKSSVCMWEKNYRMPKISKIYEICKILNVDYKELIN